MRIPPQSASNYTNTNKPKQVQPDSSPVVSIVSIEEAGSKPKMNSIYEVTKADGTTRLCVGGSKFITKDGTPVLDSIGAGIEVGTNQKPENRSHLSYGDDLATSLIIARNVVASGFKLKPREIAILKNAGANDVQIATLQGLPIAKKGSSETKIAQSTVTKKEDNFEPRTAKSTFAKDNDVAADEDYYFA